MGGGAEPGSVAKGANDRALARSASAIMHSGFPALRNDCPMNIRRRTDASRMTQAGRDDAAKVDELWNEWLKRSGGPFLFGDYSVADAMYAPVVTRFVTYAIPVPRFAPAYMQAVLSHPFMQDWIAGAQEEDWVIEQFETPTT